MAKNKNLLNNTKYSCAIFNSLADVVVWILILCLGTGCVRQNGCETVENSLFENGVLIALSQPKEWTRWDGYHVVQTAYFIPGDVSDDTIDSVLSGNSENYYVIEGSIPLKFKKEIPYKVNVALRYRYQGFDSHFQIRYYCTYRISCIEKI